MNTTLPDPPANQPPLPHRESSVHFRPLGDSIQNPNLTPEARSLFDDLDAILANTHRELSMLQVDELNGRRREAYQRMRNAVAIGAAYLKALSSEFGKAAPIIYPPESSHRSEGM